MRFRASAVRVDGCDPSRILRTISGARKASGALAPGPDYPNAGIIEEIEGNVFDLALAGRFGDYPPADEQGFFAFAKSLHNSMLCDLIKDAERVTEITTRRFPTSLRRHYERSLLFLKGLQCSVTRSAASIRSMARG